VIDLLALTALATAQNGKEGALIQSRAGATYAPLITSPETIANALRADKKDKKRAQEKLKRERQSNKLQHLSRKNPASLEAQIKNLKQIETQGRLPEADRVTLASLEKELRQVKRAKSQYGDGGKQGPEIVSDRTKALDAERTKNKERDEKKTFREILKNKRDPKRSVYYDEVWNPYGVPPPGLPWREREGDDSDGTLPHFIVFKNKLTCLGWSTDSQVRKIPMPKDNPPSTTPHPRPQQREQPVPQRQRSPPPKPKKEKTPEPQVPKQGPSATIEEAFLRAGATTIEAAPVIRDFQKEAVSFVPTAVKRRPPLPSKPVVEPVSEPEPVAETKHVEKKSFATTVEDEEDEEGEALPMQVPPRVKTPTTKAVPEKRPREVEPVPKAQVKPPQAPPPAAPAKRRRLVNAAPDV
jgi:mRNA biogenesis factor/WW domain binding protein 11